MTFEISLNSLYICVKNMDRAVEFYENLLGQQAIKNDHILTIFDIKGFRFCLFNNSKVNENVIWGDNCLPSFEVNNMNVLIEKLEKLNSDIVFPLFKDGPFPYLF